MRVRWRVLGEPLTVCAESDLDVLPRVDDLVHLPDGTGCQVRSVNFYPWGDDDTPSEVGLTSVYIVIRRP